MLLGCEVSMPSTLASSYLARRSALLYRCARPEFWWVSRRGGTSESCFFL